MMAHDGRAAAGAEPGGRAERVRHRILDFIIKYGMLVAILVMVAYFAFNSDAFLTTSNLLLIARAVSILTIISIGVTISVVVAGFDVSVGALAGLAVILSTSLMVIWAVPWGWAVLISLAVGAMIGAINAFFIIKVRIPDLLATLGMLYLAQGLQLMLTKGESVYRGMLNPWSAERARAPGEIASEFRFFGQGFVFATEGFNGIPVAVLIMLVIAVCVHVFLQYTRHGRMFYAVGNNREAARLSGIPVRRIRLAAYVLSALLATTGGLLLASRIGTGAIRAGDPYLLDAVAATFFGFAVLGARRPNVIGTVTGALFVGIMLNGLTMMNVQWFYQDFIKGFVLIASLAMSFYLVRSDPGDA
jgi:simple sugar transport system permease protein